MSGKREVVLTVNGVRHELSLEARHTLADVLRERLRLTGAHLGCEHGVCGSCTVVVDGEPAGPAWCSPSRWTGAGSRRLSPSRRTAS
ncbi:2Fe-2S iron-sulfur cluster-binding protein [Pseudonocardia sp. NPDC049154]|uniref:2Fe-2S iron-sulfur cluster-binding protein n=1 Tax=Pseudonocardia sp. NPDC049154 TaxID=3155501 RepID=UPI0033CE813A